MSHEELTGNITVTTTTYPDHNMVEVQMVWEDRPVSPATDLREAVFSR